MIRGIAKASTSYARLKAKFFLMLGDKQFSFFCFSKKREDARFACQPLDGFDAIVRKLNRQIALNHRRKRV